MAVEGAEFAVVRRSTDEEKADGGEDRAAVVFRAGDGDALRGERRAFAQGNLPEIFAGVEVDGAERAPWRSNGGIAIGVEELAIAGKGVLHVGAAGHGLLRVFGGGGTGGPEVFDELGNFGG